ncbi:hypothetical protein BJV78DRAFT_322034 [Lactifluus subvellereus]|nr:hypothetical protein BJV78DRAFT_322034 [Lactifluus subvellereus]
MALWQHIILPCAFELAAIEFPKVNCCAMVASFLAIFSCLLLLIGPACAQVSAPNCTDSSFAWSFNSLGQNPCLVATHLAAVCYNGTYVTSALPPQYSYTGPYNDVLCECNTVSYNSFSACDASRVAHRLRASIRPLCLER